MNYNDVEFKNVPKDEECLLTAVKIGELIDEPTSTVRKWAEYHENNLYIKKINGRFVYTQKSVEQFKFIKELVREKKMTHEQIRQFMEKSYSDFKEYNQNIINPKDPFGYDALSSELSLKTEDKLKQFLKTFIEYQEENNTKLIDSFKNCMDNYEQTMQEQIVESINPIKEELKIHKEINDKILDKMNSLEKELAVTKDMNDKIDNLRHSMEVRKEESEKEKRSFWSRLFGK